MTDDLSHARLHVRKLADNEFVICHYIQNNFGKQSQAIEDHLVVASLDDLKSIVEEGSLLLMAEQKAAERRAVEQAVTQAAVPTPTVDPIEETVSF